MTDSSPGAIGQTLRNRRLQKGLTLDDVYVALRIQSRFLKALEEERWDELPAPVFLEGFLVKYAEHLGLEGEVLRTQVREQLGQTNKPAAIHPATVSESTANESLIPLRLFLFGLAVMLAVGGGFLYFRRQETGMKRLMRPLSQVTESEPVFSSTAPLHVPLLAGNPSTEPTSAHTVLIRIKESVWLRIRLDGSVRFEGTLPAGEVRSFPFDSTLRLRAGNLSRVAVSVDGKTMAESTVATAGDVLWPPRPANRNPPSTAPDSLPSQSSPSRSPVPTSTSTEPAFR
ncbi:MAG: helix-turn-helix domain-containing protein [Elusimicrobia bacterium]|nr:helix-turn-helix domain-containing protein [Elusimicrobiota bacterium]